MKAYSESFGAITGAGEEGGLRASSLRWPGDKFILKTPHFDAHSSHK